MISLGFIEDLFSTKLNQTAPIKGMDDLVNLMGQAAQRKFFANQNQKIDDDLTIALARLPNPLTIIEALNKFNTTGVSKENIARLLSIWPSDYINELMEDEKQFPLGQCVWAKNEETFITFGKIKKFYEKL